jgi:hypothetical protein
MLELLNQMDGFDARGDVKVCCPDPHSAISCLRLSSNLRDILCTATSDWLDLRLARRHGIRQCTGVTSVDGYLSVQHVGHHCPKICTL